MKSLKTVQTISKVFSIFFLVVFILSVVGIVGSLIGASIMLTVPGIAPEIAKSISSYTNDSNLTQMAVVVIAETVFLIGQTISVFFFYLYFKKELEEGTPFTHTGAQKLFQTGIIAIVVPICALFVSGIIIAFSGGSSDISNQFEISLGITMILLSFVFHYGADLEEKKNRDTE